MTAFIIFLKKINKYWSNFLRGKAKYLEAKIASKIRNKDKNYKRLKKTNVLMLHILKTLHSQISIVIEFLQIIIFG